MLSCCKLPSYYWHYNFIDSLLVSVLGLKGCKFYEVSTHLSHNLDSSWWIIAACIPYRYLYRGKWRWCHSPWPPTGIKPTTSRSGVLCSTPGSLCLPFCTLSSRMRVKSFNVFFCEIIDTIHQVFPISTRWTQKPLI